MWRANYIRFRDFLAKGRLIWHQEKLAFAIGRAIGIEYMLLKYSNYVELGLN